MPNPTAREIAPNLSRALSQAREQLLRDYVLRGRLEYQLVKAEYRVAHRELQLARASARGKGGYIMERRRLLGRAITERAEIKRELAELQPLLPEHRRAA